jgi:hypothetical protein
VSTRDIREVLAQELTSAAASRREDSRQRPDLGHRRSASAVDELIAYIRALPPKDPRLRAIDALNRDSDFFLLGGEDTRTLLDRYGYEVEGDETGRQACDRFLDRLAAAARDDDADTTERPTG